MHNYLKFCLSEKLTQSRGLFRNPVHHELLDCAPQELLETPVVPHRKDTLEGFSLKGLEYCLKNR